MDEPVRMTLRTDPEMASLLDRWGPIELEPADDEFERLAVSIINQQLSTASATAVRERVFDALDGEVTPAGLLSTDDAALREAGLSTSKVEYLQNAARAFQERDLTREGLRGIPDEIVVDKLTDIRGVGEWTAEMYLIFVLGREDVLPLGDLAVRKGIEQVYGNGAELDREEMRRIGEPWRPYRSYGTRYIWREYEDGDA
jgi:DNA-3-methyladenine glycosylase II